MILARRRDIDMTSGPLLSRMLVFIFPLMITNILQSLYNAADMIVVGYSNEADAVGAIGTTGAFTGLILNLLIGLSVGANVVIARHIGAREQERASRAVHTAAILSVIIGVLGGAIGIAIAPAVMRAVGNTGRLLELSVLYARVYFAAMPFHSLSNFAIATHRAKGDTRTPLIVLSLAGLLNVCLNLFFVLVLKMSVEGVAIATGVAAALSAITLYIHLMWEKGPCHFSLRQLRMDVSEVKTILRIGLPAGVQNALFAISNIIIQSSIVQVNNALCDPNAAYQPVVKGNAAAANVAALGNTAITAAGHACVSFTSQNLGAKDYKRVRRVAADGYLLLALIGVLVSAVMLLLRDPLLALYGVKPAQDELAQMAYSAACTRVLCLWPFYILDAWMTCGSDVLRGLGKSFLATLSSLIGVCALRIVWIYTVFRAFPTLSVVYISYPITWALTALASLALVLHELKKLKKRGTSPQNA